ncbi:MAG: ABC transporter ATP-binding protein, partial [Candidatus Limnocylindrales bacterium]
MSGVGVEMRDVRLAYGTREVLRGVSLTVGAGGGVCLVGPNGAGKSSLLRCLTGVAVGRLGAVLLDGVPLEEISREALARRVAVVPGEVRLPFATRVEQVVALGRLPHEHPLLGPRASDVAAVAAAMQRVGIAHLAGRDARELSLGERQLVVLAMAVAQAGGLLILDEPTVHLDLRHQVEVLQLLASLSAVDGITVVAVLHDLVMAAHFFPRVVLVADGLVVADGPPAEILTPDRVGWVFGVDPRYAPGMAGLRAPDLRMARRCSP